MGCCEGHDQNLLLNQPSKQASILLPSRKQRRGKKRVTFDKSPERYHFLQIKDLNDLNAWYINNPDLSEWATYKHNFLNIKYKIISENILKTNISIDLNIVIPYETIIDLINSPELRPLWDSDIKKMEIIFGDSVLDATVSFSYNNKNSIELFERTVRKGRDLFVIHYKPLDDNEENYILFCIYINVKIEIFFCENVQDVEGYIENKAEWTRSFHKEIVSHRKQ